MVFEIQKVFTKGKLLRLLMLLSGDSYAHQYLACRRITQILAPKFAEYTTFIALHKDSPLMLSNSGEDACKSAFVDTKLKKVDRKSVPHAAICLYQSGTVLSD
jgi:hypothetical protein